MLKSINIDQPASVMCNLRAGSSNVEGVWEARCLAMGPGNIETLESAMRVKKKKREKENNGIDMRLQLW